MNLGKFFFLPVPQDGSSVKNQGELQNSNFFSFMLICKLSPATLAFRFHLSVVPIVLLNPMLPCRMAKSTGFGAVRPELLRQLLIAGNLGK